MPFDFLSWGDRAILVACALLIGANKAGLRGVSIIAVPLFAGIFGAKTSAAVVLPLLLTGDLAAMGVYRKKISRSHLLRLLPATLAGLAAGMILGGLLSDRAFRLAMALLILVCLLLMLVKEFGRRSLSLPDHWAAHGMAGFAGGFSTMVGNAASPIMAVYLLSMNLPKEVFIGTGAAFFLFVNVLKLPVHLFVWRTMGAETLLWDAWLAPFVLLGFFGGLKLVRKIPERPFRLFILLATLAGALRLFF